MSWLWTGAGDPRLVHLCRTYHTRAYITYRVTRIALYFTALRLNLQRTGSYSMINAARTRFLTLIFFHSEYGIPFFSSVALGCGRINEATASSKHIIGVRVGRERPAEDLVELAGIQKHLAEVQTARHIPL